MKAIKLASVFAVSAVAAAVSTTTIAAEPVFKGTAGLSYKMVDEGSDSSKSEGEVNIIGDTGVIYFDLDMEGSADGEDEVSNTAFNLDEIYVKTGAVKFGDFDGTLADASAYSAGTENDDDVAKKNDLGTDLGIRYMVTDSLTVAIESEEGTNKASGVVAFETTVDGIDLGITAAVNSDDSVYTLGVSAPLGMATVSAFYRGGEVSDADVANYGVGLDLAVTESFAVALQYYTQDGESAPGTDFEDAGNSEVTFNYTMGDIRYYATFVDYEAEGTNDFSVIGAEASF